MASVRRRGSNKYEIRVYLGRDAQGKKKYHSEMFYGTRSQADRRGAELDVLLRPRVVGPRVSAFTLKDYLEKRWLPAVKDTVSQRTYETYVWHVQRLVPVIGHLQLYGLTSGDLQEALKNLVGPPLTRKKIIGTLRTALRRAAGWKLIPYDPTEGLLMPRVPRKRPKVLNREQMIKLLEALKPYKHYLILRLLIVTGMRLGEVLGLKWADVAFEQGTITIRRGIDTRKRQFKPEGDETKTASSERTIKMDKETLDLLAAARHERLKQRTRIKVSPLRIDDMLIFGDGVRPLGEDAVRKTLRRALKRADLPRIRVHDLRHSVASILIDAGVPLATVAELLGHSTPSTTVSTYTHKLRRAISAAVMLDGQKDGQNT